MPYLLGGQVQAAFTGIAPLSGYIRSGKLTALGITTKNRFTRQPDIPAIAEFVPGYEATGWLGVGAPKQTPVEIWRSSTTRSISSSATLALN
jgi:tripartite-type tricarboxylate transporter receptor subunit TctC